MDIRKVVQQGGATYTVSLPVSWARKQKLKKNSEVSVEEKGDTIMISMAHKKRAKKLTVDVAKTDVLTNRTLLNAYQYGFDEVELLHCDRNFSKVLSELVGFEIVRTEGQTVVIAQVADIKENNIDVLFRRLFLLVKESLKKGKVALQYKDNDQLHILIKEDTHVNRMAHLIIRFLSKYGYENQEHVPFLITIALLLEDIGDKLKNMYGYFLQQGEQIDLTILKEVTNLFDLCYEYHFNHNMEDAKKIAKSYEKMVSRIFIKDSHLTSFGLFFLFDLAQAIVQIQGKQLCLAIK